MFSIVCVFCVQDCRPVEPISVDESGYLRLPVASEEDGGKYTCLVDISLDGRKYTAARSIQLTIKRGAHCTVLLWKLFISYDIDCVM